MSEQQSFRKSEKPKNDLLGDGVYALGVLTGVLICLALYLGGQVFSSLISRSEIIEILPSVTAFLVALVSLQISFRALKEQTRMRQAGVDPVLVAHLAKDEMYPLVLSLNISNVGAGAAINVKAQLEGDIPSGRSDFLDRIRTSDFFNNQRPLAVILQNQTVPHWMGTGPDLFGDKAPIAPFSIRLTYEDIEGSNYSSTHELNILEFENANANEPADTKIFRELEKIRKLLERIQK
ncbi:hypothetical protein HTT03_07655 [Sulfitobacter sp. S0837]|uniref:hypothetical protein n=1 Tax=Sulfitobacter maritimus TaxID=2741719 RepID=UPI001581BB5F|nr:hypothetical protein [Sulfitobacter maritimus]NUH65166.1 hypothetical protein [Sulfitobacter maritimus]